MAEFEPRLKKEYYEKYRDELFTELGLSSIMEVPKLRKIVVNVGVGEAVDNSAALDEVVEILTEITGQKPVITKAKKAISTFKIRIGNEIGVMVTLRGDKMWYFFDKIISIALPRTKDFRGLSLGSFDGNGNYNIGIREHTVFPEIDPNKVQKVRGMQVTIMIDSNNDDQSKKLLDKFGFPFVKDVNRS
ncbi:MAG TPA: 50S ribosomal protein L5 [bacterium]|nr:50S ribosomal protein L5 [bacterium]